MKVGCVICNIRKEEKEERLVHVIHSLPTEVEFQAPTPNPF
jgi:hypothetical protein